jgi:hypothetical protein
MIGTRPGYVQFRSSQREADSTGLPKTTFLFGGRRYAPGQSGSPRRGSFDLLRSHRFTGQGHRLIARRSRSGTSTEWGGIAKVLESLDPQPGDELIRRYVNRSEARGQNGSTAVGVSRQSGRPQKIQTNLSIVHGLDFHLHAESERASRLRDAIRQNIVDLHGIGRTRTQNDPLLRCRGRASGTVQDLGERRLVPIRMLRSFRAVDLTRFEQYTNAVDLSMGSFVRQFFDAHQQLKFRWWIQSPDGGGVSAQPGWLVGQGFRSARFRSTRTMPPDFPAPTRSLPPSPLQFGIRPRRNWNTHRSSRLLSVDYGTDGVQWRHWSVPSDLAKPGETRSGGGRSARVPSRPDDVGELDSPPRLGVFVSGLGRRSALFLVWPTSRKMPALGDIFGNRGQRESSTTSRARKPKGNRSPWQSRHQARAHRAISVRTTNKQLPRLASDSTSHVLPKAIRNLLASSSSRLQRCRICAHSQRRLRHCARVHDLVRPASTRGLISSRLDYTWQPRRATRATRGRPRRARQAGRGQAARARARSTWGPAHTLNLEVHRYRPQRLLDRRDRYGSPGVSPTRRRSRRVSAAGSRRTRAQAEPPRC